MHGWKRRKLACSGEAWQLTINTVMRSNPTAFHATHHQHGYEILSNPTDFHGFLSFHLLGSGILLVLGMDSVLRRANAQPAACDTSGGLRPRELARFEASMRRARSRHCNVEVACWELEERLLRRQGVGAAATRRVGAQGGRLPSRTGTEQTSYVESWSIKMSSLLGCW